MPTGTPRFTDLLMYRLDVNVRSSLVLVLITAVDRLSAAVRRRLP
ncbi:hypothetical protein [Streptomyces sp. NPDC058664]